MRIKSIKLGNKMSTDCRQLSTDCRRINFMRFFYLYVDIKIFRYIII